MRVGAAERAAERLKGYRPTQYLRFSVPPHTTTEPARLQQLWESTYTDDPGQWVDVPTVVVPDLGPSR